jgi:hypothetical protein
MDKNKIRLPKDGLVEPEEARLIDGTDVEGHGLPTTAPPAFGDTRRPSHGGEIVPAPITDEDDVEGHLR